MGVIVNKEDDKNNEISRRINADLRAKANATSGGPKPASDSVKSDYVTDSEYTENLKKTSRFGWVWIVLIILAIISLIFIFAF